MQTTDSNSFAPRDYAIRSSQFGDMSNPYGAGNTMQPAPKKSNTWLWILLGVGGVAVLGCCGCAGIAWWGMGAGMNMVAQQIRPGLENDPVVQQHIGEIETFDWNLMATGEATEKSTGEDVMVWDVKGSKGSGQISGTVDQAAGGVKLKNGKLKMKSGEEFNLSQ